MQFKKEIGYIAFRMKFRSEIKKADKKMMSIMKEELKNEYERRRKKGE